MIERKLYFLASLLFLIILILLISFPVPYRLIVILLLLAAYPLLFDRSRRGFLPILMLHSVSDHYRGFLKSHIVISRRNFKLAMAYLHRRRFKTLTLAEAAAFVQGQPVPRRSVVLTFDDGFLDNWINAFPILQRYEMQGTIFVTDDFIRRSGEIRPQRSFTGEAPADLNDWGYLNENEIVTMDRSDVFQFYPHAKTHTWYFKSDKVIDFHLPGDRYIWLDWNRNRDAKPDWIAHFPTSKVPLGTPVFEFGKSLEVRRFLVKEEVVDSFLARIASEEIPLVREDLQRAWREHITAFDSIGRLETDAEYHSRLREELTSVRDYLVQLLDKPLPYFCWPGGGRNPVAEKIAVEEAGYVMTTTHQYETPNRQDVASRWFYRLASGNSLLFENRLWNLLRFITHIETYRRNYNWIWLFGLIQAVEAIARRLGRKRRTEDYRPDRT